MTEILYGNLRVELGADLGNRLDRSLPTSTAGFRWRGPKPTPPPPSPLGRNTELGEIREAVMDRRPIMFHASCGYGVTTLFRYVAAAQPGVAVLAPYIYLRIGEDPLPDVLHRLVSAVFITEGSISATPSQCDELLGRLRAVVVLDDVRWGPGMVDDLARRMPGCTLVLGGPRPLLSGLAISQPLTGLPEDAGLSLMSRDLGRPLTESELPTARRVWAAVSGQPLRLRQAASLIRTGDRTLAQLAAAAERSPDSLDQLSIAALPDAQRRALATLLVVAGSLLPRDLVGTIANIAQIGEALADLHRRGLVEQEEDRFGLPICKVDSYRGQLIGYFDVASATREIIVWLRSRDPADHVSPSVAEAALSVIGFAAEQGELKAVVQLVRVVEPVLMLAGRWHACASVLAQGIQAAQRLGDQASHAYFAHQQGTLALCREELTTAEWHLNLALQLRERLGDLQGAARTKHNLSIMQPTPRIPLTHRRTVIALAIGGLALAGFIAFGLGSTRTQSASENSPSSSHTSGRAPSTAPPSSSSRHPAGSFSSRNPAGRLSLPIVPAAEDLGAADISPDSPVASAELQVTNPNNQPITITSVRTSGQDFEAPPLSGFGTDRCGSSVAGRATCALSVRFAPASLGRSTGRLTITTAEAGVATVMLSGTGYLRLNVTLAIDQPGIKPPQDAVTDDHGLLNCPGTCTADITSTDTANLVLTANPGPPPGPSGGYVFGGWGGVDCVDRGQDVTCPLSMSHDTEVTARMVWKVG
jgi:hypothetical protein